MNNCLFVECCDIKSLFRGNLLRPRNPPSPPLGLRRHPHTAKASPTSVSRNLEKIKIMEKSESSKTKEKENV